MLRYTMADVRANLLAVEDTSKENSEYPLVTLLEANHSLMAWAIATNKFGQHLTIKDCHGFWQLCQEYGFELTDEEKQEILDDFLRD